MNREEACFGQKEHRLTNRHLLGHSPEGDQRKYLSITVETPDTLAMHVQKKSQQLCHRERIPSQSTSFLAPGFDESRLVFYRQPYPLVPAQACQGLPYAIQDALFLKADLGALSTTTTTTSPRTRRAPRFHARGLAQAVDHPRGIVDSVRDPDPHHMRGAAEQPPQEHPPCTGYGGGDVGRGVPDTNGEDLDIPRHRQQARAERQDAGAVGGRALGEDGDDAVRVLGEELGEVGQPPRAAAAAATVGGRRGGAQLGGAEGVPDGAPEADALDLSAGRVADGEDGVEDGGEVDGVDGAGEAGGDDGGRGRAGHALGRLLGEGAALDAVELEVAPEDPGDAEEAPGQELLEGLWQEGDVLCEEEVEGGVEQEEGEAEGEKAEVEESGGGGRGRGVWDEGGDAGACEGEMVSRAGRLEGDTREGVPLSRNCENFSIVI